MDTGDLVDGRFRLRDRLGAGGMAVVWRAGDEVLGRDVALKVLDPDLAHDAVLLARVRDEARAVARLRHPNIVDVYDYGEAPGPLPYVVMEVAEGRSLSRLLSGGPLPWRVATLVGAQVAAALAAAHDRGVVHRDVKPGNVMVGAGRVKLVDFGISASTGDDDLAGGQLLGTPAYLAPERLEDGVVRPATDVYALGLLLFRMLAGRMPWDASTVTQMVLAHRYREPGPLPPIAGLPAEVASWCLRCLDKDPDRRPAAGDVAVKLAEAAGIDPKVLDLPGRAAAITVPDDVMPHAVTPQSDISHAVTPVTVTSDTATPHAGPVRHEEAVEQGPPDGRRARAGRLSAGVAIWRAQPRGRRLAAVAGAAVLLSGGITAVAMPGGPSGPAVEAAAPQASTPPTSTTPATEPGASAAQSSAAEGSGAPASAAPVAARKVAAVAAPPTPERLGSKVAAPKAKAEKADKSSKGDKKSKSKGTGAGKKAK
ncbi:serine/threonine-protein kinase [Actinoplanes sp. NPDC023714]|uniref:serine/threonine-protein kinase n=1 Tax=Actinoplanes sp. NPDC023714 TaxID=3154322 RepID=UPI00340F568E